MAKKIPISAMSSPNRRSKYSGKYGTNIPAPMPVKVAGSENLRSNSQGFFSGLPRASNFALMVLSGLILIIIRTLAILRKKAMRNII